MDVTTNTLPSIILVPGHWLGAWAWDAVASELRARGHAVTALTLPGLDPDDPERSSRTLDDQVEALGKAVAAASGDGRAVVLVAHSGAGIPVSVLLDQNPTAVSRVVYVDSGPVSDGSAFDRDFPVDQEELELPPFDQLQASLDGLSESDLRRFRERAVPQPGPAMRQVVRLTNDARRDVPSTIIACSFPSEVLMQMARAGNEMLAETASLRTLELVDLPTGHWPMWSRPAELAAAISTAAVR
ncbi:alpha/beta fold hydrolase [Microterricola viridarii]|uniref:Esterase n=1 Tax=Microterricola viridarii TaxID=412690 RepID=A0A120I0M0_9MICO|nr:alpha/beta hydrolase [Microterricola viridarii]AMB59195.1 esterase [Microterricola viridarii]